MKTSLIYIIRNNFEERGHKQSSILGTFSSFSKAYQAAHEKAWQMKDKYPKHRMELKTMPLNGTDYNGCSAYQFDFLQEKSEFQLQLMEALIQRWCYWRELNIQVLNKIDLRALLIKGLSDTNGVKPYGKVYKVIDGDLTVDNNPATERDCEFVAHHIFYFEDSNLGNEIEELPEEKDVLFNNARKMGDSLFRILSSKDCLVDMLKDNSIPNATYGQVHPMSVEDFLNEIEKGLRQTIEYRKTIMKRLYPNCSV